MPEKSFTRLWVKSGFEGKLSESGGHWQAFFAVQHGRPSNYSANSAWSQNFFVSAPKPRAV